MTHTVIEKMARAMAAEMLNLEQGDDPPDCYRRLGMSEYADLARAALLALRDSVDHSTPVTAQIVRAYVDGVLGEEKVSDRG